MLPWGDSSKLKVAEWVLAIGNPFQLNQTVTLGIVSALGRSLGGTFATYEDFIQTDAAINPGNSGGALINARGELIGINTAIFSDTGGYQGIGFAVPSNLARHVDGRSAEVRGGAARHDPRDQHREPDHADRGGARRAEYPRRAVNQISPRAEAYLAGLRAGDIIISFNGRSVEDASALMRMLADSKIGTAARLEILRESRRLEVTVPVTRSRSTRTAR